MTTANEHAGHARVYVDGARSEERTAEKCVSAYSLTYYAQSARLQWVESLVALLRFVNALPEPVAIPPVPQPSEEARRRGLLVGAVVQDDYGALARVVTHGPMGSALVQWARSGHVDYVDSHRLTVIRTAPVTREPNAESARRGLYIGARVDVDGDGLGTVVAWDVDGDPFVEFDNDKADASACPALQVTLAGDAS